MPSGTSLSLGVGSRFGRWSCAVTTRALVLALTLGVHLAGGAPAAHAQDVASAPADAGTVTRPVGPSEVHVSEFMTVDIVAQNSYVTDILQKLAIQARRNIVPSFGTERLVTANIYGVSFAEALTGLLEPNGLGFVEKGDFIFVYTLQEMTEREEGGFGTEPRLIELNYLRSEDARKYAQPMLSSSGSIEVTTDVVTGSSGEQVGSTVRDTSIYTPEQNEFDLKNGIVVHDTKERLDRIEAFLRALDTRPDQVLLEASIIQTTLTENTAFGVDFALLGNEDFFDFFQAPISGQNIGFTETTTTTPGANPGDPPITTTNVASPKQNDAFAVSGVGNVGAGRAGIRAGYVGNVGLFLRALDQVTDVTLLSNPKIMTLNRQRAKVFVGQKVSFLETTTVENVVSETRQTIDVGIILDIRPFVLSDGRIRLELSPKVSDLVPGGTTPNLPDENIQSVTTDILIPEGYTAVIGGLFREDTSRARNQVPILGDLPLIGPLFQGRDDALNQVEIIFLIKPSVIDDESLGAAGFEGREYGEDVRVGSRLGLLPWSRERQSARLNLEAERLLIEGEVEEARWRLRRSLGLHPAQPDVVRAIEKLEDRDLWMRDLSLLNQLVDREFLRRELEDGAAADRSAADDGADRNPSSGRRAQNGGDQEGGDS